MPIVGVIAYNNLSTAIILLGIAVVMSFVASPKYAQFFAYGGLGIAFGSIFIYLERYRAERIKIWLNPEDYEKGYQTLQGLYAIGSGKLFGKGLGESMQKLGFLPEAQNDMIFSIICEELGLFGAVCVILLFLLMLWRFMVIANNAHGYVWSTACGRYHGTYFHSGYFKYRSCNKFYSKYRYYTAVYQLWRYIGSVSAFRDGIGTECVKRNPVRCDWRI